MRKLLLFTCFFFALLVSTAGAQDIYLTSRTPLVSKAQLRDALPAFQRGADKFHSWWGGEVTHLTLLAEPGAWVISITDGTLLDPAGFHWVGPYGPYAVVFAANGNWQITLSHELFEMLADPFGVRTLQGDQLYLVEVCDPVETHAFNLRSPSGRKVKISDWVGPEWYLGGHYFDAMHLVKRAHQILPGGYVNFWDGFDWVQSFL